MKPNNKQKRASAQKTSVKPVKFTPEQKKQQESDRLRQHEWDKLTKFPEYYAKSKELGDSGLHQEKIFHQAINIIHGIMFHEEWFAEHTPYPFKVSHWSRIALLASLTCDYLQKLALSNNQDAVGILGRLTVEMM